MPNEKYLGTFVLANDSKKKQEEIDALCRSGKIKSKLIGTEWYLAESELERCESLLRVTQPTVNLKHTLKPVVLALLSFFVLTTFGFVLAKTPILKENLSRSLAKHEIGTPVLGASLSPVFNGVTEALSVLVEDLLEIKFFITDNWFYYKEKALFAWQDFTVGKKTVPSELMPTTDPATVLVNGQIDYNKLKSELLKELQKQLANNQNPGGPRTGLVVLPSSGDPGRDELIKQEIRQTFSDEVTVKFDQSGRAGIITPQFQVASSSDYLFLLTPIRN